MKTKNQNSIVLIVINFFKVNMIIKSLIIGVLAVAFSMTISGIARADSWDKVFTKSDAVNVKKVSFKNRYGIKLVGDLYIPKNINKNKKLIKKFYILLVKNKKVC